MKKTLILPIVGVLLLVVVLIKIFHDAKKEKAAAAIPAATAQAIHAECVVARDTLVDFTFKAVGNIRANVRVELVSELSLRLVSVHFAEGTLVQKGDLLFQLDDAEWKADLKRVRAKLDLAVETEKRNKEMFALGGISQQTYDESVSNRRVLEAEEESLNVRISKARIRAPFSGVIGIRKVSEGAFLSPGAKLAVLEDLSRLKVDLTVPEAYAPMVRKGDRVTFRIDGSPRLYQAQVVAVNPSVNTGSGSLELLAIVGNPDKALTPGMAVSITLTSASATPSVYVPTQALIPTPGGYHIYALRNGRASYRSVVTGMRSGTMVEIVQGIIPGDSVLVTGFMKLRPDSRVKVIKVW